MDAQSIAKANQMLAQARKKPTLLVTKPGTLAMINGRVVLTTLSGAKYIDNYATNRTNVPMNNSTLKPNRYIPMVQPRTTRVVKPWVAPQLSNSTTFGSGSFTGKLSMPVSASLIIKK